MLKLNRFGVFPCLPLIYMYKGRVYDVTHCYNLGEKSAFLHTN